MKIPDIYGALEIKCLESHNISCVISPSVIEKKTNQKCHFCLNGSDFREMQM